MRLISNEELGLISGSASQTVTVRATRMTDDEKADYDRQLQSLIDECIASSSRAGGAMFSFSTKQGANLCDLGAGNVSADATLACVLIYDQKNLLEQNGGDGRLTSCQIEATAKMSVKPKTHGGAIKYAE